MERYWSQQKQTLPHLRLAVSVKDHTRQHRRAK
jgi:hypothetical protein